MSDPLDNIEHIVILMLENRSFDHMLGYLSLPEAMGGAGRDDVDGLTTDEALDYNQPPHKSFPLKKRYRVGLFRYFSTMYLYDPPHDPPSIERQVQEGKAGFTDTFRIRGKPRPKSERIEMVMGYYTGDEVPVFDFLAAEFCVCDRWFSSVRGPTWPNRIFSMAGSYSLAAEKARKENEQVDPKDNPHNPKWYVFDDVTPFFVHLDDWRCYIHDFAWLWAFDGFLDARYARNIRPYDEFLDDARHGRLPPVCWIEPSFDVVQGFAKFEYANDDHPGNDVGHAQRLVLDIYHALLESPNWQKTLFIVTYDEHGGFYDHVDPTQFAPQDDDPVFREYGFRVPALVISPWVKKGSVSREVFDHASIPRTVMKAFCKAENGQPFSINTRVDTAHDLGVVLADSARTDCVRAPAGIEKAVKLKAVSKFTDYLMILLIRFLRKAYFAYKQFRARDGGVSAMAAEDIDAPASFARIDTDLRESLHQFKAAKGEQVRREMSDDVAAQTVRRL